MQKLVFAIISACLLFASPAESFVKCVNDEGEKVYSDTTCPQGFQPVKEYEEYRQTSTGKSPGGEGGSDAGEILQRVRLTVIDRKQIASDNSAHKPRDGNVYYGVLVEVKNDNEDVTIFGGDVAHSVVFLLKTSDGYTKKAENMSPGSWDGGLQAYSGKDLYPKEADKGWVFFEIAKNATPKKLYFKVSRVNSPDNLTDLGEVSVGF